MIYIKIDLKQIKVNKKTAKIVVIGILSSLMIVFLYTYYLAVQWGNSNRIVSRSIVKTQMAEWLQTPIAIEKIETEIITPVVYIGQAELDELVKTSPNPTIAEYICKVFGPVDCPTAIAVSTAESGMRADAFNFNTNNTLDYGVFQINSVHWKKEGCSMKDLVDPYKNVDCAKKIKDGSGWSAWVVVQNGSYLSKLGR